MVPSLPDIVVVYLQVVSDFLRHYGLQPARLLCPRGFSRQEYWSVLPCPPPGDLPNPGIEPRSPALQADSLPSESPRKPKNTGVGSLFLLQGIFPTQELNQSLLHCRWILYQLSYQRSPNVSICLCKCQNGTVVSVGHRDRERTGKMINFDFIPLWFHYLHYAYINFIFGKKKRLMN